jgi:hypothetical protein
MGLSTKNVGNSTGGGVPKLIQPGTQELKVNSIEVQNMPFDAEQKQIVLNCETRPIENFEGFFFDKNDESKGKHDGQVGRINAQRYPFSNYENGDIKIDRDDQLMRFMKALCISTNTLDWFESVDDKYETIEDLVGAYNAEKPFANKWLRAVVCGKEYQSSSGYTNYQLFFERSSKAGLGMETIDTNPSKLVEFTEEKHILKLEEKKEFSEEADDLTIPEAATGDEVPF